VFDGLNARGERVGLAGLKDEILDGLHGCIERAGKNTCCWSCVFHPYFRG
jgi:hypothetical protein